MTIDAQRARLRQFAQVRDWERFHTPKNLIMALVGEVGELSELFQWLTEEEARKVMEDPRRASRVREEVADVIAYLLRLCDVLDIDLSDALDNKIGVNEGRYPVEQASGNATKYTDLGDSS